MFVWAIIEYFSLELTRLRDLICKLSTHFNYRFNKIQAAFTKFKITFRSLVWFFIWIAHFWIGFKHKDLLFSRWFWAETQTHCCTVGMQASIKEL